MFSTRQESTVWERRATKKIGGKRKSPEIYYSIDVFTIYWLSPRNSIHTSYWESATCCTILTFNRVLLLRVRPLWANKTMLIISVPSCQIYLLLNGAHQIMRKSRLQLNCCLHCSRGQSEFHYFRAPPYLYLMAENGCYQYSWCLN